jgi:hypothetical protein
MLVDYYKNDVLENDELQNKQTSACGFKPYNAGIKSLRVTLPAENFAGEFHF